MERCVSIWKKGNKRGRHPFPCEESKVFAPSTSVSKLTPANHPQPLREIYVCLFIVHVVQSTNAHVRPIPLFPTLYSTRDASPTPLSPSATLWLNKVPRHMVEFSSRCHLNVIDSIIRNNDGIS